MVGFGLLEFGFHLRCDERVAVDLSVRVREETPISCPWFSNGKICSMPSILEISAVRNAHASTTVRRRETGRSAGRPFSSGSKQITSQRPAASFFSHSGLPLTYSTASERPGTRTIDGKRFSNTTTL